MKGEKTMSEEFNDDNDDLLDLLEADLESQLANDFDPGALNDIGEDKVEPQKDDTKKEYAIGELVGKKVRFFDEDDDEYVVGEIIKHTKKKIVVDVGEFTYELTKDQFTVIDDEEEQESSSETDGSEQEQEADEDAEEPGSDPRPEVPKDVVDDGVDVDSIVSKIEERVVDIDAIRIPKKLVREFRKGERWDAYVNDVRKTGQKDAIEVHDPNAKKPVLTDGLRRLTALKELGCTKVRVRSARSDVKSTTDRLIYALKANLNREDMLWIDTARTFAMLRKEGMSNRKIAQEFSFSESKVSRMVEATRLPKPILAFAEDQEKYSESTFLALVGADKKVLKTVRDAMDRGRAVTVTDVKALIKEAKKNDKQKESEPEDPSNDQDGTQPDSSETPTVPSHLSLKKEEIGKAISIKVKDKTLEMKFVVPWKKKTFRTFDPVAEVSKAFEEAFADEDLTIDSFAGLLKRLSAMKAELG